MKPQCSLARARLTLSLSILLSGSFLANSAFAFRPQNPSANQSQDDDSTKSTKPAPTPAPAPAPPPARQDPPAPRHSEDATRTNRSESRPSPERQDYHPQPRQDTQPSTRHDERRVDAAPTRPAPAQEPKSTNDSRPSFEPSHSTPANTTNRPATNEPRRHDSNAPVTNREQPSSRDRRPQPTQAPESTNTIQPSSPSRHSGQTDAPSQNTQGFRSNSDPHRNRHSITTAPQGPERDHGPTQASHTRPPDNKIVDHRDRDGDHRRNSNAWHPDHYPVRPMIVIPNHENTRRYDRNERWHERTRIWTGYNHESRRSWGLHFYDPFYYEWIFCGGRYYYWRGTCYSAYSPYYQWDYDYTPEPYSVAEAEAPSSTPICFPPNFPPLGAPPPSREINPGLGAPGALLAYLNEPFYASLSTRLLQSSLLQDQKLALYQYRDHRDSELALLQREIELATADSPERSQARLTSFAEEQTPRLRALEARAEALRVEFMRKGLAGLLLASGSWNERRDYYLNLGEGGDSETDRMRLDFLMLRAAVYYQDGLSRTQRDLLREAATELQLQSYITRGGIENEEERNQYIFFSPGGVQIPIGPKMPMHIVKMLQTYTNRKTELKDALIAQLYSLESTSDRRRSEALENFARGQEHAYLFLENLAEQIRVELVRYPQSLDIYLNSSVLPQTLVNRIDMLSAQRLSLAEEYNQQYLLFNQSASPAQVRVLNLHVEDPDPNEPPQLTLGSAPRMPEAQRDELRERIRLFNESNARRHAILRSEQNAILIEIENLLRTAPTAAAGRNAAELLDAQLEQSRSHQTSERYRGYQQAALLPGLSIEQRRLLLGNALSQLGLPLPPAE